MRYARSCIRHGPPGLEGTIEATMVASAPVRGLSGRQRWLPGVRGVSIAPVTAEFIRSGCRSSRPHGCSPRRNETGLAGSRATVDAKVPRLPQSGGASMGGGARVRVA